MAARKKYVVHKYDGDDQYSWAIFKADDVRGIRGIVFYGEAEPLMAGLSRSVAKSECDRLNNKELK